MQKDENYINVILRLVEPDPMYDVVMTLTPISAAKFRPLYLVQILQGEENVLPDGRIEFKFNLEEEDAMVLKRAISNCCFGNPDDRAQ
jgi:hypothetical protein